MSGLVIIRGHQQQGVGAGGLGVLGQHQGGSGVIAAGAGDDLDPAGDLLDAVFHGFHVLFQRHGGGLAGGAADADGVRTGGDLTLDQLTELVKVHLVVIGEGGDDGNAGTGKNGVMH